MGLTNGFSTSEENYVAVCGYMAQIYPWVVNSSAQAGIIAILKEMVSIYPDVFRLEFEHGIPVIRIIEETKQ
jgi:hypothetical protein